MAVGCDVSVPVQQITTRDSHIMKRQSAVINPVEPTFNAIIFRFHSRQHVAVIIADRHIESMDAVVDSSSDELREHYCGFPVNGSVTDEFLPGGAEGRV